MTADFKAVGACTTTSFPCCNARTASCCHRSGITNPAPNPGVIPGRCLQCGLLAIGIATEIDGCIYFVQHTAMSYAGLTYSELSARFSELRQAVIGDRRAPHKPLLVLLMLGDTSRETIRR